MRKFRNNLGSNLRVIRGEVSQTVFAKKIGIGQASLNRIENKEQNITIDMLEIICTRLKISPSDLLDKSLK